MLLLVALFACDGDACVTIPKPDGSSADWTQDLVVDGLRETCERAG